MTPQLGAGGSPLLRKGALNATARCPATIVNRLSATLLGQAGLPAGQLFASGSSLPRTSTGRPSTSWTVRTVTGPAASRTIVSSRR